MYEFKKEYEIGVKEIDSEHRQFFAYLNSAVDALDLPDEQAVKSATELLDVLMAYAAKHFKHEEAYMRRTNSPELAPQIDEHLRFKKTIASMTERKGEMSRQDLGTLFVFMAKWLREHILTADMRISHDMPVLAMTPDFMTGIELIDDEHAALFALVAQLNSVIENETAHDRYDAIVDALDELRAYTVRHFADEEEYMRGIGYDGLPAQLAAHEAFVDKVNDIDLTTLSDSSDDQMDQLRGLVTFLTDWLVSHILKMDKKISASA